MMMMTQLADLHRANDAAVRDSDGDEGDDEDDDPAGGPAPCQ